MTTEKVQPGDLAPLELQEVSCARCFGGEQKVFRHVSTSTGTPMRFAVYLPPAAASERCPVLWYLSGLTCTEENVITKSGFQRAAAQLGLVVVCPDTSPRGAHLDGEDESWDFGSGAGFYVDATREPWARHYRMYSYVTEELRSLVEQRFPVDAGRQGITGHSMGGHGALVCALKQPARYLSVSAFAPIAHPMVVPWGQKAFRGYLGDDESAWRAWDAVALLEDGARFGGGGDVLVDQGENDGFLDVQLRPETLEEACAEAGVPLTLRRQAGYDHSYYFISTFIDDHLAWHAERLALSRA